MLFRNINRSGPGFVQPTTVILPSLLAATTAGGAESAPASDVSDEQRSQAELRRQMYERIAQGNALAEAEEYASRRWTNR